MSSQRGNTIRTRPQRHMNKRAFNNKLHDTSDRTRLINSIQVADVCARCKDIIEWKIKYKKYKPLTQPKKCVKCDQRTVTQAYHVMCSTCGRSRGLCTKCCQGNDAGKEIEWAPPKICDRFQLDNEMKYMLKMLSERSRRTFLRFMFQQLNKKTAPHKSEEEQKNVLVEMLQKLSVKDRPGENDDIDDGDDSEMKNE